MRLDDRSTGELVVVALAATICVVVVLSTIGIAVIEIIDPANDSTMAASVLSDVLNTLIGVVAGFLAGRTEAKT